MAIIIPKVGDWVAWLWLSGVAEGQVVEVVFDRHEIISKSKKIARNGTKENPAIVIDHKSGNQLIKLASELLPGK